MFLYIYIYLGGSGEFFFNSSFFKFHFEISYAFIILKFMQNLSL